MPSVGEGILLGLCSLAALITVAVIAEVVYQLVTGANLAIGKLGLAFLLHQAWAPNFNHFGVAVLLFGTVVSSLMALLLAVPIGVAIGLYLSLLAGYRTRAIVGPLVELVAAVPTVILGLWGILVLSPSCTRRWSPPCTGRSASSPSSDRSRPTEPAYSRPG